MDCFITLKNSRILLNFGKGLLLGITFSIVLFGFSFSQDVFAAPIITISPVNLEALDLTSLSTDPNQDIVMASGNIFSKYFHDFLNGYPIGPISFNSDEVIGTFTVSDVNLDGIPDLITANSNKLSVYVSDLQGGYDGLGTVDLAIDSPIIAHDFTNDGRNDVVFHKDSTITLLKGDPVLIFESIVQSNVISPIKINGLAASDIDGDGFADLLAISEDRITVFFNNGNGQFTSQVNSVIPTIPSSSAGAFAMEDVSCDGLVDVVIGLTTGGSSGLFLGDQTGVFTQLPGMFPNHNEQANSVAISDVDHDSDNDIVIATGDGSQNRLFYNDCNNILDPTNFSLTEAVYGPGANFPLDTSLTNEILVHDYNDDGWDDFLLLQSYQHIAVYHNNGGNFAENSPLPLLQEHIGPYLMNSGKSSSDGQHSIGTLGFFDIDGDGINDYLDNCKFIPNPNQENVDGDNQGNVCDIDTDADSIFDSADNCDFISNTSQEDTDSDGIGDACEEQITCAVGTFVIDRQGSQCVSDPITTLTCGPGTILQGDECVQDPTVTQQITDLESDLAISQTDLANCQNQNSQLTTDLNQCQTDNTALNQQVIDLQSIIVGLESIIENLKNSLITGPSDTLNSLILQIQILVDGEMLDEKYSKKVLKDLDDTLKDLQKGNEKACKDVSKFVKDVNKLVKKGDLSPENAQPLLDEAEALLVECPVNDKKDKDDDNDDEENEEDDD